MKLIRKDFRTDGIFGQLFKDDNTFFCYTLEHAFVFGDEAPSPAVHAGSYLCVRGDHTLPHKKDPFETFMLTEVPGHTGILIHPGNYQDDSSGCILVGDSIIMSGRGQMITNSTATWLKLLEILKDTDSFFLTVQ